MSDLAKLVSKYFKAKCRPDLVRIKLSVQVWVGDHKPVRALKIGSFSDLLGWVFSEAGQIALVLVDFYGNGSKLSSRQHLIRKTSSFAQFLSSECSLTCTCCSILFHWLELSLCSIVCWNCIWSTNKITC